MIDVNELVIKRKIRMKITKEEQEIANEINSYDLEFWSIGREYVKEQIAETPVRGMKIKNRVKMVSKISKYLKVGPVYDWKEERKMKIAISKMIKKGYYVYNSIPDSDSYGIVYSKIKLPKIERIA